jgi:ribonucleotide reductase beta subunit family protein with ferritin-like domain
LTHVPSESDERIVNNTMRHQYRVLSDAEKAAMTRLKDHGLAFLDLIKATVQEGREASIAKTKVEEAVMWAVKGLTG